VYVQFPNILGTEIEVKTIFKITAQISLKNFPALRAKLTT
jgi:hypothetical protein